MVLPSLCTQHPSSLNSLQPIPLLHTLPFTLHIFYPNPSHPPSSPSLAHNPPPSIHSNPYLSYFPSPSLYTSSTPPHFPPSFPSLFSPQPSSLNSLQLIPLLLPLPFTLHIFYPTPTPPPSFPSLFSPHLTFFTFPPKTVQLVASAVIPHRPKTFPKEA
ncbi:hypothetical protein Pcinc_042250 [Petrolisthes cinctipes]|uniref:Uncharacterized protein n=1 Tax=Petrolisthes cinctipes TaxID=88211 RepID=A0AAE1BL09_PETCI|nr:hypothetical protein Pcinc_042250 [Petrolisthes cinctipes]